MLTGPRARVQEVADDLEAARRGKPRIEAPRPGGDVVAAVSPLQTHAGNRATAMLLGGRSHGRATVQRDALAGTTDEARPSIDPSGREVDPATLSGDGETGAKPSDWAQPGGGGDGPAPPLPATTGDETLPAAGGGQASGGGSAVVEQATNLLGNTLGAGATPLAGGGGQPGGGQVTGGQGTGGQVAGGQGAGAGQAAQGSGATPAPGGQDWTQRPEGAAIIKVLSASSIGQDAIAAATKYAVVVVFQARGRPAAYDAGDNHCYLDPATATNELATYFVHEMYHARQAQLGLSPLPDKAPDREAWVDSMVKEEITATYRSFEARVESGISTPLGAGPLADAWNQYMRVRRYWREETLKSSPNDTGGAEAVSIRKGRALIEYLIVGVPNGGTLPGLGPDRISSYADFYRRQWNTAHRARP